MGVSNHLTGMWTGIWTGMVEWTMEWTMEFLYVADGTISQCSSIFCPFPFCQTSEEPPLLQWRLLGMYRVCQMKFIKYVCNIWPLLCLWLQGGCTNEGQYKADLAMCWL